MREKRNEELAERLVEAVRYLEGWANTGLLDLWYRHDLTIAQAKTLALLERQGPSRMGVIAGHLDTGLSAATTLVGRLVEKGLAQRVSDPTDRRLVICELTDTGRAAMDDFLSVGRERVLLVADMLDREQLEAVVKGLELLREAGSSLDERGALSSPAVGEG